MELCSLCVILGYLSAQCIPWHLIEGPGQPQQCNQHQQLNKQGDLTRPKVSHNKEKVADRTGKNTGVNIGVPATKSRPSIVRRITQQRVSNPIYNKRKGQRQAHKPGFKSEHVIVVKENRST